jgi:PAS domain
MSSIAYALAASTTPPQIMPAGTVEHPHLLALLAYWEHLRGASLMPARAEPRREISHLLKYVYVCDVLEGSQDFRFQLIGNAAFQGLSENQTGRLISEHPDMGVRLRFPIMMREVVLLKKPVRGVAVRKTKDDRFHAESIWLPFGGSEVKQVMGMTVLSRIDADGE